MHSDYDRTLSAHEIDNLIGFLQQVASSRSEKRPADNGDDGDDQ